MVNQMSRDSDARQHQEFNALYEVVLRAARINRIDINKAPRDSGRTMIVQFVVEQLSIRLEKAERLIEGIRPKDIGG